ncbi:hypothetical protein [Psychrobacillus phage Perkons]|nr:hypothetical protein [Psychrobacillus phage Perkons]
MNNKVKLFIQIEDEIIRNKLFKLDANTFVIYAYLKYLHFRTFGKNEMEIDHNFLKNKLYINDNRTVKRSLEVLHKQGVILELINKLPSKGGIKVTFNDETIESNSFTQLPVTILHKIEHIGVLGVRLLFYYESFINRNSDITEQFAFPSVETTAETLGISFKTVYKYNEILKEKKLLKVDKHELDLDGYDNLDNALFTKYNNHYYVKLDKL